MVPLKLSDSNQVIYLMPFECVPDVQYHDNLDNHW